MAPIVDRDEGCLKNTQHDGRRILDVKELNNMDIGKLEPETVPHFMFKTR